MTTQSEIPIQGTWALRVELTYRHSMSIYMAPSEIRSLPALAASTLLLRDSSTAPEVLMVRRKPHLRFLGGYWVFPGGSTDTTDAHIPLVGLPSAKQTIDSVLYATATRELYEETGILVAAKRGAACREVDYADGNPSRKTDSAFGELLAQTSRAVDLGQLRPWARWITPSAAAKRYDTCFFLIVAPNGQEPRADDSELDSLRWIRPREWAHGEAVNEYPIAPPTQFILRELANEIRERGSLRALLGFAESRMIRPVLPKIIQLRIPRDREHRFHGMVNTDSTAT